MTKRIGVLAMLSWSPVQVQDPGAAGTGDHDDHGAGEGQDQARHPGRTVSRYLLLPPHPCDLYCYCWYNFLWKRRRSHMISRML